MGDVIVPYVQRTSYDYNARALSTCAMGGFQPLADFTDFLDTTGLQNLILFAIFALDGLNSNRNSALGHMSVFHTLRENTPLLQLLLPDNYVETNLSGNP